MKDKVDKKLRSGKSCPNFGGVFRESSRKRCGDINQPMTNPVFFCPFFQRTLLCEATKYGGIERVDGVNTLLEAQGCIQTSNDASKNKDASMGMFL